MQNKNKAGLTGNQLKLIALISMTLDHVGLQLFPDVVLLRILGRLALPIFAYMIAEGCRHTRSRKKYLGRMVLLAALCQAVYFFAMGSLYQCILVTFSLSIVLIYAIDNAHTTPTALLALLALVSVCAACLGLPRLLQERILPLIMASGACCCRCWCILAVPGKWLSWPWLCVCRPANWGESSGSLWQRSHC